MKQYTEIKARRLSVAIRDLHGARVPDEARAADEAKVSAKIQDVTNTAKEEANMASFKIEGGTSLSGSITPQGAKNEALQVICTSLLTANPVVIHNIPDIRDVNKLIDLLISLRVKITKREKELFSLLPRR